MAGLSTAKTIERWLLPHQVISFVDHVAELCKVIRRLVQAADKISAALAWSSEEARFSRLSESGTIPPYWLQEIRKALADDDWLQAKVTLATLLEPSRPRPQANKRPKLSNHASVHGSGVVMGTRFISTIHTVTDNTVRACVGQKLTHCLHGAHRSSIGIWFVSSARTLQPSQEKLNDALWV
jgi:hypothetical protein